MPPRPPGAFVHGLDGPVAVVSGRVAAWLERRADLNRLRLDVRGVDGDIYAQLTGLHIAALAWRTSATGSEQAQTPEAPPPSEMTTVQVADRLGISDRAVRIAIEDGRLEAVKVAGRYRISAEAFAHFRAARAA